MTTKQYMVILRKAIKASNSFVFSNSIELIKLLQADSQYKLQINRAGTGGIVTKA